MLVERNDICAEIRVVGGILLFQPAGDRWTVDPLSPDGFRGLLDTVTSSERPTDVVYLWDCDPDRGKALTADELLAKWQGEWKGSFAPLFRDHAY